MSCVVEALWMGWAGRSRQGRGQGRGGERGGGRAERKERRDVGRVVSGRSGRVARRHAYAPPGATATRGALHIREASTPTRRSQDVGPP